MTGNERKYSILGSIIKIMQQRFYNVAVNSIA